MEIKRVDFYHSLGQGGLEGRIERAPLRLRPAVLPFDFVHGGGEGSLRKRHIVPAETIDGRELRIGRTANFKKNTLPPILEEGEIEK